VLSLSRLNASRITDNAEQFVMSLHIRWLKVSSNVYDVPVAILGGSCPVSSFSQRPGYPARLSSTYVVRKHRQIANFFVHLALSLSVSCFFHSLIFSVSPRSKAFTAWLIEHRPALSNFRANSNCEFVRRTANLFISASCVDVLLLYSFCTFCQEAIL
jgi:hypothetical protein